MTSSRAGPTAGPPGSRGSRCHSTGAAGPCRPPPGAKIKSRGPQSTPPGSAPGALYSPRPRAYPGATKSKRKEGRRFSEVRYGRFERSLTVPAGLDPEKVTARYENGVLEVTAPLPPGFASRKVPIQIESHGSKKAA